MSQALPHYRDRGERLADLIVHLAGLALALVGGGMLLGLAIGFGHVGRLTAATIYAVGLLTMLALSTAYNFAAARYQPLLRRFDHAGIFLMIAGSYTPFTTQHLSGTWSWGMTAAVWSIAGLGIAAKLLLPGLGRAFWIAVYVVLGWLMVIALEPLRQSLGLAPLILLAVGGRSTHSESPSTAARRCVSAGPSGTDTSWPRPPFTGSPCCLPSSPPRRPDPVCGTAQPCCARKAKRVSSRALDFTGH